MAAPVFIYARTLQIILPTLAVIRATFDTDELSVSEIEDRKRDLINKIVSVLMDWWRTDRNVLL